MLIGYARVSNGEQTLNIQVDSLQVVGCEKIFADNLSDAKVQQSGLQEAMDFLRPGDTLAVWRLDRLRRSLKSLVLTIEALHQREIGFRSLQENIDTTTPAGKLQFHVFSALAEFERDLKRERTQAGLRAARTRGRMGGRPKEMTPEKLRMAVRLMKDPEVTIREICMTLGVAKSTLYRYVSPSGDIREQVS